MDHELELGHRVDEPHETCAIDPDFLLDGCLVVGGEGSGKTTLGRTLVEEHLRVGIPVIAIDTTGDLTAWLQSDFGLEISKDLAEAESDSRIRLKNVGLDDFAELFAVPGTAEPAKLVAALLAAINYRTRALTPESALLERLVHEAWDHGSGVTIDALIAMVLEPPFTRLGLFPLDVAISAERRRDLASALRGFLVSAAAWDDAAGQLPDLNGLLMTPDTDAALSVLSFGQHSQRVRLFAFGVLLAMIEARNPRMLLLVDEAAAFIPSGEKSLTSSQMKEALLGGSDYSNIGIALVAEQPADLHEDVADLCGMWIVGRMPSPQSRRQVVESLDLVNPPIDDEMLDRTLAGLELGEHVLRSPRLDSLVSFRSSRAER